MLLPDEPLESETWTLFRFVETLGELLNPDPDQMLAPPTAQETYDRMSSYIELALTGRYTLPDGTPIRVTVDALTDMLGSQLRIGDYKVTRDIDSVIGISNTLPYLEKFGAYPLPPFKDTLTKHNRMFADIQNPTVSAP